MGCSVQVMGGVDPIDDSEREAPVDAGRCEMLEDEEEVLF